MNATSPIRCNPTIVDYELNCNTNNMRMVHQKCRDAHASNSSAMRDRPRRKKRQNSSDRAQLEKSNPKTPVFRVGPKPRRRQQLEPAEKETSVSSSVDFRERKICVGRHWIQHKIRDWPKLERIPCRDRYKLMPPYSERYNTRKHSKLTYRKPTDRLNTAYLLPQAWPNYTKRRLLKHYGSELNLDFNNVRLPAYYDHSPILTNSRNTYFLKKRSVKESTIKYAQLLSDALADRTRERLSVVEMKQLNEMRLSMKMAQSETPAENSTTLSPENAEANGASYEQAESPKLEEGGARDNRLNESLKDDAVLYEVDTNEVNFSTATDANANASYSTPKVGADGQLTGTGVAKRRRRWVQITIANKDLLNN